MTQDQRLSFNLLSNLLSDAIDSSDRGTFLQLDRAARENLPRTHDCPLSFGILTTALKRIDENIWRQHKVPRTERRAAQIIRALANRLVAQAEGATTSQTLMYIWHHLVCQIVTGEGPREQTFIEFRFEYLNRLLTVEMDNISPMMQQRYPELVSRAIALDQESRRIRGKGLFNFILGSYLQVDAHRQAAATPWARMLRYEDRFERAVNGMWNQDGKILRSDKEVLSLITTIITRINVRYARIEAISQQVRKLFSLSQMSKVRVVLSSDNPHLHDIEEVAIGFSRSKFIIQFEADND